MKFLTTILRFRFETEIHSVKANATTDQFTIEVEMAPEKADLVISVNTEDDKQPVSGAAVRLDCNDPSTTDPEPDYFGPTKTEDGDEPRRYEMLDAVPWAGQGSCRLIVEKEGQVEYVSTLYISETSKSCFEFKFQSCRLYRDRQKGVAVC